MGSTLSFSEIHRRVREDTDEEELMEFLRYATLGPDQCISMLNSVGAFKRFDESGSQSEGGRQ